MNPLVATLQRPAAFLFESHSPHETYRARLRYRPCIISESRTISYVRLFNLNGWLTWASRQPVRWGRNVKGREIALNKELYSWTTLQELYSNVDILWLIADRSTKCTLRLEMTNSCCLCTLSGWYWLLLIVCPTEWIIPSAKLCRYMLQSKKRMPPRIPLYMDHFETHSFHCLVYKYGLLAGITFPYASIVEILDCSAGLVWGRSVCRWSLMPMERPDLRGTFPSKTINDDQCLS